MAGEHLGQLLAEAQGGIEGLHGILEDHGDAVAPDLLQLPAAATHQFGLLEADMASGDLAVGPQVVDDAVGDGALAAPGFAHQSHRLAFAHRKRYIAHRLHVPGAGFIGDAQVLHLEHHLGFFFVLLAH